MTVGWVPGLVQAPSGNHGGPLAAKLIVMHYTASHSAAGAIAWLRSPASRVSAHFVVGQDGAITQLVPCNLIAWHAGHSAWTCQDGTRLVGLNKSALGIELDYDGPVAKIGSRFIGRRRYMPEEIVQADGRYWPVYPEPQLAAAASLVRDLWALGATITHELVGHEQIAPGRKSDPGPAWPWDAFRARCLALPAT